MPKRYDLVIDKQNVYNEDMQLIGVSVCGASVEENPRGEYVKFEDYAALAEQVEVLRGIKRYNKGSTTVSDGYERWSVPVLNEDKNGNLIKAEEFDAILAEVPHHLRQVQAKPKPPEPPPVRVIKTQPW